MTSLPPVWEHAANPPSEYAIAVRNLNKHFGPRHVVKDVSLQVKPGEIFGFLGPNGSGKTTTIRLMCGLLTPDSGEGLCLGFDILRERLHIKRRVGYMTQKFSYWDDLTIAENLEFVARIYELPDAGAAVQAALRNLGLEARAGQLAGTLSGGWKQRMALAACMLPGPRLLLLDEPTAGVDPAARRDFWEELHRLAAQGIAVLVSTHYMDEAERCHKLAYIVDGQLLAQGTADEITAAQGLATWALEGGDLAALEKSLRQLPQVLQIATFGQTLHISGLAGENLEQAINQALPAASGVRLSAIPTSLEDVFIYLMNRAQHNRPQNNPTGKG